MARFNILSLFLLFCTTVWAANPFYLAITDRTGKSILTNPSNAANAPRNAVAITSFSFSVTLPLDAGTGGSAGQPKPSLISINRTADANSALILTQEITNAVLPTVTLTQTATNIKGASVVAVQYTLTNAGVVNWDMELGNDGVLRESLVLRYQKVVLRTGGNAVTVDAGGRIA